MDANYDDKIGMQSLQLWLDDFLSPRKEENLPFELPLMVSTILNTNCLIEPENVPFLPKYCIRLSAMVQSKSSTVRWCACVLIKLTVHANVDCIGSHGAKWVNLLVRLAGQKNEISLVKTTGIKALCEIFSQVKGKPTLTREIATPNLSTYAGTLIDLAKKDDATSEELITVILVCLTRVLVDYPTTLKPWVSKLRNVALQISANPNAGSSLIQAAREALAISYSNSHSQNAGSEWRSNIEDAMERIKTVSFYSLRHIEGTIDWNSQTSGETDVITHCHEAIASFGLLKLLLQQRTSTEVEVPVGKLIELVETLQNFNQHSKFKPIAGKSDKQVTLSIIIPQLHEQCFETLTLLVMRFTWTTVPFLSNMFFYLSIEIEGLTSNNDRRVYAAILKFVSSLLSTIKVLPKSFIGTINNLVACVIDFIHQNQVVSSSGLADYMSSPDSFLRANTSINLLDESFRCFANVLRSCPDLSPSLRSQIDRLMILHPRAAQIRDTLPSTLLYTTKMTKRTILPIAVRIDPCDDVISTLIHPRLPPLNERTSGATESIDYDHVLSTAKSNGSELNNIVYQSALDEPSPSSTNNNKESEDRTMHADGNVTSPTLNATKRKLEMTETAENSKGFDNFRKKQSTIESCSLAVENTTQGGNLAQGDPTENQVQEISILADARKEDVDSDVEIPDIDINEDTSDDE